MPSEEKVASFSDVLEMHAKIASQGDVCGDCFAVEKGADGSIFVMVADVTGKGGPAAIYASMLLATFKYICKIKDVGPEFITGEINDLIIDMGDDEMGASLIIFKIDALSGATYGCNAGHENPICIKPDGTIRWLELDGGGPPAGVVRGYPYPSAKCQLSPGDTILLVTDGVTEASDTKQNMFGREGLESTIRKWSPAAPVKALVNLLVESVRRFEGETEPSDDVTVFAFRRKE